MLTAKHIAELWGRMARIYGPRWTSSFGEADDGTWLTGLRSLDPEDLAHGLRACIAGGEGWPPTLPEFRRLALGITRKQIENQVREMIGSFSFNRMTQSEINRTIQMHAGDAAEDLIQNQLSARNQHRLERK